MNRGCMRKGRAHRHDWASRLLACLQEMAEQNTNAVLLLLEGTGKIKPGRQYPEGGLLFAGQRWRAFYHCHWYETDHPAEHGHFHVFANVGDWEWAHVAGLAIDWYGQPVRWFTVNRLLTGGSWLEADRFRMLTGLPVDDGQDTLIGRWLYAMLGLYRTELLDLLRQRDACIQLCRDSSSRGESVHDDRSVCELSTCDIELESTLVAGIHGR